MKFEFIPFCVYLFIKQEESPCIQENQTTNGSCTFIKGKKKVPQRLY